MANLQTIELSQKEADIINDLLTLTGDKIYDKYGFKRDETITHTAKFPDGIEADIKLVICEDDTPYAEGVLFLNGSEITHTECEDTYAGMWKFEHNGTEYLVNVIVKEDTTTNTTNEIYTGNFGDGTVASAKTNILPVHLNTFDSLEYECWELIQKYAEQFNITLEREDESDIDFHAAKEVQNTILLLFKEAGFKFVEKDK